MAATMTSIRLDKDLADEAVKLLGVKTRTEAVHVALGRSWLSISSNEQ